MRYRLRKYNIDLNLKELDLDKLKVVWTIVAVSTVTLMLCTFATESVFLKFIVMLGCLSVLSIGIIDYIAQIEQRVRWPEFNKNNYFWVFNSIVWIVLFLTSL